MSGYPRFMDNGDGELLVFERRVPTPRGERVEGYNRVKPGGGPPFHTHFLQDEGFTVVEGRLGYQIMGQPETFVEAGGSALFPAGVAHRFWNAGEGELRCDAWLCPPGNIEYFLGELFAAQQRAGGTRPPLLDASFLMWRYRSEIRMDEMPAFVRRVVVPVAYAIGRLTGHHRKYAGAPAPLRPAR